MAGAGCTPRVCMRGFGTFRHCVNCAPASRARAMRREIRPAPLPKPYRCRATRATPRACARTAAAMRFAARLSAPANGRHQGRRRVTAVSFSSPRQAPAPAAGQPCGSVSGSMAPAHSCPGLQSCPFVPFVPSVSSGHEWAGMAGVWAGMGLPSSSSEGSASPGGSFQ